MTPEERESIRRGRECRWPGCRKRREPPEDWGCRTHNARLPKHLRSRLTQTRNGQARAFSDATLWAYNQLAVRRPGVLR